MYVLYLLMLCYNVREGKSEHENKSEHTCLHVME